MAETNTRGPINALGAITDTRVEQMDGPSLFYQGVAFPDPRSSPARKDGLYSKRVASFLTTATTVVDAIPSTVSAAGIAALANASSGVAMVLTTVAPGGSSGVPSLGTAVPILPFGATAAVNVLALDFGFTTGTLNGTATVTVPDSTQFSLGEWIHISGAGNTAKTIGLFCQVLTAPTATTITVSPAPAATLTAAPIGHAGLPKLIDPLGAVPIVIGPHYDAGFCALTCPQENLARCVSVTGVSGGAGGAFLVSGYDIYFRAMSETITAGAGVSTVFGQKAFKYIASVVPQFSDAHNYSVGWGDTFGLPLRSDLFEHTTLWWGGKFPVINTGFAAAVTSAASPTTGDVRGTVQLSSNGNGSALASPVAAATNGTLRLVIAQRPTPWQMSFATPLNGAPLFGVAQA